MGQNDPYGTSSVNIRDHESGSIRFNSLLQTIAFGNFKIQLDFF